jgi:hypothetical protein
MEKQNVWSDNYYAGLDFSRVIGLIGKERQLPY